MRSALWVLILAVVAVPLGRADIDLATDTDVLIHGDRFPGGAGDFMGWDVTAGDLDGDGVQDLLISAPYADGPGDTRWSTMDLYLIFGRPAAAWPAVLAANGSADVIFYGGSNPATGDSNFPGWDLACGDIDGDGFDDLAFSAPHADGPAGDRNATGAVYIYYGRPRVEWAPVYDTMGEVGPAADIEIYGADENDAIGGIDLAGSLASNVAKSLALADLTGDGRAEIIFGAVYADGPNNTRNSCGDAYVIFGDTRGALTQLITVRPEDPGRHADIAFYGGVQMDFFGFCLAVGDLDGDTFGDLTVGALYSDGPAASPRNGCGDAFVFWGRPREAWSPSYDVLAGDHDRRLQGRAENGRVAYRLAAGDIDGDARADLVLATPHNRVPVRPQAGEWQIFFGRDRVDWPQNLDLATSADVWFQGRDNTDVWGTASVERWEIGCDATLGDTDGDGRADLLLGAKFGDSVNNSRANAGEAFLILGREQSAFLPVYDLQTQPEIIAENVWGVESGVTGDVYHYDAAGHTVLLADLTGAGTCDLVLTAPFADGPGNTIPEAGETYIVFSSGGPAGVAEVPSSPGPALTLWPNPTAGDVTIRLSAPPTACARIEIFDALGRLVLGPRAVPLEGGQGQLAWDGRDTGGRRVPAGTYWVRSAAGTQQAEGRVLVLR